MFFQLRKDNRSVEYQLQRENPIAVFDSGVGGISVLRELIRIMPVVVFFSSGFVMVNTRSDNGVTFNVVLFLLL